MNPTTRTYKTGVSLEPALRGEMIGLLNQQMADAFDLYSQVKQAHWNVKGMNFIALHELFDEVADTVLPTVDTMAERVTALGGEAQGTARMAAASTTLPEFPTDMTSGEAFVEAVAERVAAYANGCRKAASSALESGDEATGDLFIEITRDMDKMLYFLEAHLQG